MTRRMTPQEVVCPTCSETFVRTHGNQVQCSNRCTNRQNGLRRDKPKALARSRAWKERTGYNASKKKIHAQRAWYMSKGYLAQVNRRVDRQLAAFDTRTT